MLGFNGRAAVVTTQIKRVVKLVAGQRAASIALLLASASACSSSGTGNGDTPGAGNAGQVTAGSGGSSNVAGAGGNATSGASGDTATAGANHSGGTSGSVTVDSGSPPSPFAIASASRSTCAIDGQGLIHCWGEEPGVWAIPDGPFVEIHASVDAFCAVRADRSFACFDAPVVGAAPSGIQDMLPPGKVQAMALDRGCICWTDDTGHSACNSLFTNQEMLPPGVTFSAFKIGFENVCGLSESGTIQCWGYDGEPSAGQTCDPKIPPAGQLEAPSGSFTAISGANYSACALDEHGAPKCWGPGKAGDDPNQLYCGVQLDFGQAAPPAGATFRSLQIDANHGCGVKTDGTLACWGAGSADVDCPGSEDIDCRQSRPPAGTFTQVSLGALFSCAMTEQRKVQCWGYAGTGDGRLDVPAIFQ